MNPSAHLTYGLSDRPPFFHLVLLGLQYTCMMFPYLIIIVILDQASGNTSSDPIRFSLIALGIATLLQGIRKGPVGSGYLAPPVVSAIYFPASMEAVGQGGLPLVYGMTLFAGLFEVFLGFFLNLVRKFFPPIVCGLIIMAVGFQLGLLALSQIFSIRDYDTPSYPWQIATSCCTLLVMIVLTVWAKGMWRLLSPFFGIVIGFALSLFLKMAPGVDALHSAPWISLPSLTGVHYAFSGNMVLSFCLATIASVLRVVGGITTCQKINVPQWTRPDLKNIRKGVFADGIGCLIAGFLGVAGVNTAPSLIGVSKATGATSRSIAYSLAIWLIALAFFPKFIYLFLSIPLSVMGAALLFTASFMIAGGVDLVASRIIDTRGILIIGISLLLGVSQRVFASYFGELPEYIKPFTNSLLSVVTLSAFLLNLFFRIKIRQKVDLESFDEKAKEWGLSPDFISRIHKNVQTLVDQINQGYLKEGDLNFKVIFDPAEVVVICTYHGEPPKFHFEVDKEKGLIEETSFILGISSYLVAIAPDEVKTSTKGGLCSIKLQFHI